MIQDKGTAPWRNVDVHRHIVGMRVDSTTYGAASRRIVDWAKARESRYVCVANVNNVMHARDDESFLELMNDADLVTPDGMPLVWGLRWLGLPDATRVYGPDLTSHLLGQAEREQVRVGFLGGTPQVIKALVEQAVHRWPQLHVTYVYSPPFRPLSREEDERVVESINDSATQLLFVGLGCPKQEIWMAQHQGSVNATMVGVGAAFDFLAGSKKQAPPWLQQAGLEWAFRLVSEPGRLWKRYLWQNPRFMALFGAQLVRTALRGRSGESTQQGRSE